MYSLKIDQDAAELYLYSMILGNEYAMQTTDIFNQLNKFTGKRITLHINSEGGDITEALGMYTYLLNHSAKVYAHIEAICASAAVIVALAADKISMSQNAMLMIHNPSGAAYGESEDMRKLADVLDKFRESIALIFEQRRGIKREKVIEYMQAETWFNAQEALDANIIDAITPPIKAQNSSKDFQAGVIVERERIKALDDIANASNADRIYQAKYETFQTAGDIALDLLRLQQRQNDSVFLMANTASKADESQQVMQQISSMINAMRGYKA